jgi:hypothetical protein
MTTENKPVEISRYEAYLEQIAKIYNLTEEGKKEEKENSFYRDEICELYTNPENNLIFEMYKPIIKEQ